MTDHEEHIRQWFAIHTGGSLLLPDGWYGRPRDGLHLLTQVSESEGLLQLELDGCRRLTFVQPREVKGTDESLEITAAGEIRVVEFLGGSDGKENVVGTYAGGKIKLMTL